MENEEDHEEVGSEEEEEGIREKVQEPNFPADILELDHSFGYNCKRLFNLVLIDDDTLIFASGNFLHYFTISTRKVHVRRSEFNVGIGFITKNNHPDHEGLLTVGENGPNPTIFIYEYPSHDVRIKLEGAAKASFTCGAYNSTGELFASQAGHPDFQLTIWRWETAEKLLRARAFQNDVLFIHFSIHNPILLCTAGLSHIKFWKMARTFTGLKLQGDLGRFGKTDFSDIYATYMLPDENVISGCDWGNILMWEAGLIKFEITRKGRKPCHSKPIMRISVADGELTTVGMDGYVRVWFWETIDLADPPDDDRFVEIEPMIELKIPDCEIRGLAKIKPYDDTNFEYYAQDGHGGIWYCDFNIEDVPKPEEKIFTCHGGKVIAAQVSPISPHLMTLGGDGKIFVYNYKKHELIFQKVLDPLATEILWFSTHISLTGLEVACGYSDGVLRHMLVDLKMRNMNLLHAVKGHTAPIVKMAVNPKNKFLIVTAADLTVFLYDISGKINNMWINIIPMGFIPLIGLPTFINWRHDMTALLGTTTGEVLEVTFPKNVTEEQTFLSYQLEEQVKVIKFVSVKSRIRRDIRRKEIKRHKLKKRARKMKEIEKLKKANPGLQIDVEAALADSEPDEDEPPLFIPGKPNPILWLKLTKLGTIWVSMGGYDAGYIYELAIAAKEPVRSTIIEKGDDIEIHSYLDLPEFSIHGMVNGNLRVNLINPEDFTDLHEYRLFRTHDHLNGIISSIVMSFDSTKVFSVGYDGNIFMYNWNGPVYDTYEPPALTIPIQFIDKISDISEADYPSLEQEKILAEKKRQEDAALAHKRKVQGLINKLADKFFDIYAENEKLNEDVRLHHREMLLDDRIVKEISDELQFQLDDVRDDLAYDLEVAQVGRTKLYNYFIKDLDHIPIMLKSIFLPPNDEIEVYSFALRQLDEEFEQCKRDIEERLRLEAAVGVIQFTQAEEKEEVMPDVRPEGFFFGRDPKTIVPRFSRKMLRLLRRYRARQRYEVRRIFNWDKLISRKPDPNVDHPDDVRKIKEAEKNLGDYKLKIGADYEAPNTETLTNKYIETVDYREKLFNLQNNFNKHVFALRDRKKSLYEYIKKKEKRLDLIHKLLPKDCCKYLPELPPILINEEYPNENLIELCTPGCGINIKDILYLEKSVQEMLPKPIKKVPEIKVRPREQHQYQVYSSLRIDKTPVLKSSEEVIDFINSFPITSDSSYFTSPNRETMAPCVALAQYSAFLQLQNEQHKILSVVKNEIDKYNSSLKDLHWMRSNVKLEAQFMQSYMITLNQELMILRDSEEIENRLLQNADAAMKTRNEMQVNINASNRLVEECRRTCDKINEQISTLSFKFLATVKGHKFYDFLRRIFKKKFKPPKPPHNEDESSESSSDDSSSSEDEADTKSIDSTDITTIRLDEDHCPAGLERTTYEFAFKMRSDRHALEAALLDQFKMIDMRRGEVAELLKKMKFHEEVYERERETLTIFRHKRQLELNKVKVSLILDMSQIQHFNEGDDYRDVSKAVLFDGTKLTQLHNRVDQLKQETLETKRWHRINFIHLRRMNADINWMHYEIIRLEECIRTAMMKKFGMILPLDDLEESVLSRYVFELETTAEEQLRAIEKEINEKKRELTALFDDLIHENKRYTEKINVLGVLQQELNFLNEVLIAQERYYDRGTKPFPYDLDGELEKLIVIDRQQKLEIECIEREICTLRMKAKPLQMDMESVMIDMTKEFMPPADGDVCPDILDLNAYNLRVAPDEFVMDRVLKIVQKFCLKSFGEKTTKDQMRFYAHKIARYLGQIAYSFEGNVTERIIECITESLQDILPKKYLIYLSRDELMKMFNEILAAFDYERSEINTEDLISGIFGNAVETVNKKTDIKNKTQFIIEHIFKELLEVLPLEEFENAETKRALIEVLLQDPIIEPRCISVEILMTNLMEYARENLLDNITAFPLRRLVEYIAKELKTNKTIKNQCSIGSVASVQISEKKRTASKTSLAKKS